MNQPSKNTELKWWIRYVGVPIIIALIGGGTFITITIINNQTNIISSQPTEDPIVINENSLSCFDNTSANISTGITQNEYQNMIARTAEVYELLNDLDIYRGANQGKSGTFGPNEECILQGETVFWTDLRDTRHLNTLPNCVNPVRIIGAWGVFHIADNCEYTIPDTSPGGSYLRIRG